MDKLLVKRLITRRTELQKSLRAIHAEVDDIERLIKRYTNGQDHKKPQKKAKSRKGWVNRDSNTKQILEAVAEILAKDSPKKPREMVPIIEGKGHNIPGTNPANNLSAMLSGAKDRFKSLGRGKGWVLK